ncbi:alpha/beta hydrolase [Flavobacterium album]|uniref:Alpha/beta hydrolase n=1 Tax=Flavobacterium album TaxID=2175091 RepID=A0A2S1QZ78_9FLAO|nr:alpha/beta hydrolase [Flavobacterium album]AWH85674.1 alpha/beta hydrolase [Flavobacterium album]
MKNQITIPFDQDPAISTATKEFLKALNSGGVPLETLSPEEARLVLVNAQKSVEVDYSGIEESEKTITQDGYNVKLNIVRPEGNNEKLPVFIFIHGGGWVLGDYPTHKRMVRDLVVLSGAVGVFVNYTPSPEAKYPQATEEIYAATKWVAENGSEINVDGSRLAIAGNSVGGNMTAVTAIRSIQNNGPKIANLVMLWPIVAANFETETYQQFGQDRFLTTPLMKWMYDQYTTDLNQREEIYASPLNAPLDVLKHFPPTFIPVAEADVLREEGEAFGRKLDEAGVEVTTIRYNGMIHDWGLLNPLAHLPQTKALFRQAAAELKKYLFA